MSKSIVPVDARPQALTAEQVERLPAALQYALERRYYEDFDHRLFPLSRTSEYDIEVYTRFFPLLEISHGADLERALHHLNMHNVISSLRDGSHSLIFLVNSDGRRVRLYLGVSRQDLDSPAMPTDEYVRILQNALQGNFPGLECGDVLDDDQFLQRVRDPLSDHPFVGAFTGIPSLKQEESERFFQGLERLVDGLHGESYSFMIIAEPIPGPALDQIIDRCQTLSSEIHMQVRRYVSTGESRARSESVQQSRGESFGLGTGVLVPLLSFNKSFTQGKSRGRSTSESKSRMVGREVINKAALYSEQILDLYIARLQRGKSLGLWNTGVFLLTDNKNTYRRGQGIIRGLFAGVQSHLEPLRSVDLSPVQGQAQSSLLFFRNPPLDLSRGTHPLGEAFHKLATPLTTDELAVWINFPRREVPGVKLRPRAEFGINPPTVVEGIELGQVLYQGKRLEETFRVTPKSLTRHVFIPGITGAGKTNTCLVLLQEAFRRGVPFLVIEPAKTEYRALLADPEMGEELQVFTLGEEKTAPFRLNPFEFVRGFNLLTHIDFLKAVFNASFPMYASMPYILEEAILEVYTDRGWNIAGSYNHYLKGEDDDYAPYLPTLSDLYEKIDPVVQRKRYAQQLTMDISAALKARLKSLLNGGKGLMLNTQRSIPLDQFLNKPTILELRYVGDDDEKAFLMALLLVLIYEYAQVQREGGKLEHLTLIEEAHRLLKNIPPSVSMEVASSRGKAVEMFTDILAEVREYGEGFVIVDQIPSKLTPDVVKNTNLKILHRLVAADDRSFVGSSMGLDLEQQEHIVRLGIGEAVVHSGGLDRPILIHVHRAKDDLREAFKEQMGLEQLKERMAAVRRANQDVFRRWPGCWVCDDPCEYLSDWNRPDRAAQGVFNRFFATLLYGDLPACLKSWQDARNSLFLRFSPHYSQTERAKGIFVCQLVQMARTSVHAWFDYYSQGARGLPGKINVERQTMAVLQAMLSDASEETISEELRLLRDQMWGQVARRPAELHPGCVLCRRKCRYGYLVQRLTPVESKTLTRQIQMAMRDPQFHGNFPRLVRLMSSFSRKRTGIPIINSELPHLGYCYLTNHSRRKHVLSGYQQANPA